MTIALELIKWAWKFIRKNWPILVVIAGVVYLAWFFHSMRDEINELTYINENYKTEVALLKVQTTGLLTKVTECNQSVGALKLREQYYKDRVSELEKTPPAIIYKYRDRIIEVDNGINADTCEGAVAQMASLLGGIDE